MSSRWSSMVLFLTARFRSSVFFPPPDTEVVDVLLVEVHGPVPVVNVTSYLGFFFSC